jgi:hypothetical protein
MKSPVNHRLLTVLVAAAGSVSAWSQSASVSVPLAPAPGTAPAPTAGAFDRWSDAVKKPAGWFSWGGDFRARNEYSDTMMSLTETDPLSEQDVVRFRARVWASAMPVTNVSLNVRFSGEAREWIDPSALRQYKNRTGMEWRYGIFDNLNVKWANAFGAPLTITAGRQDIMLGDYWNWWLCADGTPGDGSWAFFLDSVRLTYDLKDCKTKLDAIYIYQNARPDEWIPTLGRSGDFVMGGKATPYMLTEQNEQGVIFNVANKSLKNTQLDGYFIYKRDNKEAANGDNANIYTLGARITGNPAAHWQYQLEGAYQFGEKQDPTVRVAYGDPKAWRDLAAYGANARVSYLCRDHLNNQFHLVGEYLSGDDPSTKGDEMFDVLWGRWPRWSELYIYSYVNETGGKIAQWNNLTRFGAGWTMTPIKGMHVGAYYNALFAPESVPTRATSAGAACFSNDGNFRGHYLQAVLKHQFNKHITAHLWGEWVFEGDYYAQRDLMTFIRAEVLLTF